MSFETSKGALVFTHMQNEGACAIGKTLFDRGLRIKTLNVPRTDLSDIDPLRPDIMVFMGGPIGVYQADDFPFIKTEIEILKARCAADKPTIGICLGAQLIAAALGSKVYKGKAGTELGWIPLELTEEGKKHPNFKNLTRETTNMFHWHGDTYDLPAGAKLLAGTHQYPNQIFQYGENVLGIQAHPEVRAGQLEEWFVTFCDDITGPNPKVPIAQLRADTAAHIETLNTQATKFFNAWLEERGL